jgi:transketolase
VESNGHGSMLIYSLLYLTGCEKLARDEIRTFRELGSHCKAHPQVGPSTVIEITTGLLSQGIANAAGMAVAESFPGRQRGG